ncbi:phytoene desaturase family protein [Biformimicrobium ophioploci]|uniref:Pyridine nucleotide-disulfide oxidoreductase domain-containing protein 2 n=1 Tax=Biformimicrobium ophioploci TaxID=3036711 RepID=A0ABQ6M2F9_9GAMM|nr:NAD(P)/FAD-dependent oxidoreductase [Microbulbifer sp. NKW57]GMG88474.1 NAD(P)/FAD-dependent oxidoreductase [Microbulbifer sp. NKW57]
MGKQHYDALVIGAGHNGLTNAAFLAKSGLKVLVVEKNPYIGGASVSRELYENWTYSNCSYVCSLFRPEIYRELNLAKHGLQVTPFGGSVTFTRDGNFLGSYPDPEVMYREVARFSKRDANALERYHADTAKWCRLIRPFLMRTPPDPTSFRPKDWRELAFLLKKFHGLGEEQIYEFMRFFTLSVAEFLGDYFESDLVKAHFSGSGIIGTGLGPFSPGTAYVLLHHYMGDVDGNIGTWGIARGGMGAIAKALAGSLREFGGEILTGDGVERILVKDGRVTGVALESGAEISADNVVSNVDAKRTFLKLMDEKDLPAQVIDKARNFKIRGSSGKLNIALDGLPTFTGLSKDNPLYKGDFHFSDSLERIERAYDDWKAGMWSRDPYLDMLIPTLTDPTMAPPGKHMMSVFVQYCPAKLADGDWTDDKVRAFGDTVIDQMAEYSPDLKDLILHAEVRTPREIEAEVGLTEGNIFQGELTLDQLLFNRPFPGYAQYRGPVKGMYMCGSSTHPGGGVMAAPGANAAREMLADLKRDNTVPEDFGDD